VCISLVHVAREYSDIMAKQNRLPPVWSLSAYCFMILVTAKKAHGLQIWPQYVYCQEDITPILLPCQACQWLPNYWHSFGTPLCYHSHWCISVISTSAAWCISASVTSPVGLSGLALAVCKQRNLDIQLQVHTTISYFINHCYSMPRTSDWLFLKQWLCHVKQYNRILLSLVL